MSIIGMLPLWTLIEIVRSTSKNFQTYRPHTVFAIFGMIMRYQMSTFFDIFIFVEIFIKYKFLIGPFRFENTDNIPAYIRITP